MSKAPMSVSQYRAAMQQMDKPGGSQNLFLRAHARSRGGVSNTLKLQAAAGYANRGGINLRYGLLAEKIARKAGYTRPPLGKAWLSTLVDFVRLDHNGVWELRIYPQFVRALKAEHWI